MSGNVADVVPEDFDPEAAAAAHSTTPADERKRCPNCRATDVVPVFGHQMSPSDVDHDYRCGQCGERFDDPVVGDR